MQRLFRTPHSVFRIPQSAQSHKTSANPVTRNAKFPPEYGKKKSSAHTSIVSANPAATSLRLYSTCPPCSSTHANANGGCPVNTKSTVMQPPLAHNSWPVDTALMVGLAYRIK